MAEMDREFVGDLTGWRVAEESPVLLCLELGSGVGLPQVVEGGEEDDTFGVGGEGALDGAECSSLVCC